MAKDNETKNKFIELRAKGLSFDKISKELGVTKLTLIQWSRGYEVEIKNLKSIELDALREKFMLTNEKRMEITKATLDKILKSLESRDFDEIPTDKLLGHLFKILEKIEDSEEVEFISDEAEFTKNMNLTYRKSWTA